MKIIETERLYLRHWKTEDLQPFFLLNSDIDVMRFMPKVLTKHESDLFADKIIKHFEQHNFGFFACELKATNTFIGFVGLSIPHFEADFTPCVEIGWRLAKEYWNKGLATEAAQGCLHYGFFELGLQEIVSFTVPDNLASRKVMEKIKMQYIKDFEHPSLAEGHPLKAHVLYKKRKNSYLE